MFCAGSINVEVDRIRLQQESQGFCVYKETDVRKIALTSTRRRIQRVHPWQLPSETLQHGRKLFVLREVVPLVGILGVVIEFLIPISVADVSPTLGAEGVVVAVKSRQGRMRPNGFWIFQQRQQ